VDGNLRGQVDNLTAKPHHATASKDADGANAIWSMEDMKATVKDILKEQEEQQKADELAQAREKFEFRTYPYALHVFLNDGHLSMSQAECHVTDQLSKP
jgi:hypothetical protein